MASRSSLDKAFMCRLLDFLGTVFEIGVLESILWPIIFLGFSWFLRMCMFCWDWVVGSWGSFYWSETSFSGVIKFSYHVFLHRLCSLQGKLRGLLRFSGLTRYLFLSAWIARLCQSFHLGREREAYYVRWMFWVTGIELEFIGLIFQLRWESCIG
jgi:hypothetical protein